MLAFSQVLLNFRDELPDYLYISQLDLPSSTEDPVPQASSSASSMPTRPPSKAPDREEVRSDAEMVQLLASLQNPYHVAVGDHHNQNNCLIDSILQSLQHQGYIHPLAQSQRKKLCQEARVRVCNVHNLPSNSYPMLEHDVHARAILRFFTELGSTFWLQHVNPESLQFSVTVLDRSNRALVQGVAGDVSELVETNPVSVEPVDLEAAMNPVIILLYCYTFRDSTGYHYDWIATL